MLLDVVVAVVVIVVVVAVVVAVVVVVMVVVAVLVVVVARVVVLVLVVVVVVVAVAMLDVRFMLSCSRGTTYHTHRRALSAQALRASFPRSRKSVSYSFRHLLIMADTGSSPYTPHIDEVTPALESTGSIDARVWYLVRVPGASNAEVYLWMRKSHTGTNTDLCKSFNPLLPSSMTNWERILRPNGWIWYYGGDDEDYGIYFFENVGAERNSVF